MKEPRKLSRIVIKEELVALTGDFKLAIVLNQMMYWQERRRDADLFIEEEKRRYQKFATGKEIEKIPTMESSHGWIYKKAEDLAEETMIGVSAKTMLTYLNTLVKNGWIQRRRNPYIEMDRTYQYRVDLVKIQNDLFELGYALEGYDLGTNLQNVNSDISGESTKLQNENSITSASVSNNSIETPQTRNLQNVNTSGKNVNRTGKNVNPSGKNVKAIPETTTDTKTEIIRHNYHDDESASAISLEIISFGKYTGIDMKPKVRKELYLKWRHNWGFSKEMVFKAGEIMALYTLNGSMEYIERVLRNWKSKNINTLAQVTKNLYEYKKPGKAKSNNDDYEIYVPDQR